jgi:hypothetical protein
MTLAPDGAKRAIARIVARTPQATPPLLRASIQVKLDETYIGPEVGESDHETV